MAAPADTREDPWSTHDAFDAEVGVTVAETGLYLVAGHDQSDAMPRAVAASGAQVVAAISPVKLLAVMAFGSFQQLRVDPAVRLVGPVALDATRFAHFQQLIGAGADTGET